MSQIYFWNETLRVSDSSSVRRQEFFAVHTAMVYVTQVCWQLASRIRMELRFSNLFLVWNSTCFGQFLCPLSGVFHCTHSNGICHTGLLTACKQDQDGTAFLKFILGMKLYMFRTVPLSIIRSSIWVPSWSCSQAVSKSVWPIPLLCVQWKTPDNGQRNCPKHLDFHSKNKFEKLVHLVGIIIRKCVS